MIPLEPAISHASLRNADNVGNFCWAFVESLALPQHRPSIMHRPQILRLKMNIPLSHREGRVSENPRQHHHIPALSDVVGSEAMTKGMP